MKSISGWFVYRILEQTFDFNVSRRFATMPIDSCTRPLRNHSVGKSL
jgi:hypothetical protein